MTWRFLLNYYMYRINEWCLIFQVIFEMVLAMDDFNMFVRIMTLKNIELQEQVLRMMAKTTGSIPESFQPGGQKEQVKTAEEAEEELLAKVME